MIVVQVIHLNIDYLLNLYYEVIKTYVNGYTYLMSKGVEVMSYILLIIGFGILVKGADYFVEGASSIARKLRVPPILIGLTIVAFGTSSPEAVVSINAAIKGSSDIAIGNVIGSSIFNILMVIGVSAIIKPINIKIKTILKEFPFLLLASIVLYILASDVGLQGFEANMISRADGLILLSVFLVFLYYLVEMAVLSKDNPNSDFVQDIKEQPTFKSVLKGILGLFAIILGGDIVVRSGSSIAMNLGMSETLVGLTIIAIGTSLPELVTSIVAAYKGESDIAVGNAIGSNMFNIVFILGVTPLVRPITVDEKVFFDMIFLFGSTVLAYMFSITKKSASRSEGLMLVISYIAYMVYIIIRN